MIRVILSVVILSLAVTTHASSYCTFGDGTGERIYCLPNDGWQGDAMCASSCEMEDGQSGYCPDYTPTEFRACSTQCFTSWGAANCDDLCMPAMAHTCILGQRP